MDDGICAVCAEALEWVAYGPCGHHDVCATCIARLRFVCDDRRCCICKSLSNTVFVTKALGSFTRTINDFSILPAGAKDGKVGSYWFHEATQAYFDDFDQYKIIKAMCRLSCGVCDKLEVVGRKNSKRRGKFKNVEQLKEHLSRQHELFFCNLCLENKKVFICEQKLYTRLQLRQHIRDGGSEVDGDESERCGFSGHPPCEFCQRPFYGDNELYFHLSTEHYTCHICQRQHPNHYQYYKDYDDLENHFHQAHFLCEDDSCLEKKFVVFASEADMKRHNALEHGGNMSRSKRSATLQLSTCFRYQDREEETRHVRVDASRRGVSNHQLSSSTHPSAGGTGSNVQHHASLIVQAVPGRSRTNDMGSTSDAVLSPGQVQGALLDFRSVLLSGSDFPRLPRTSKRRRRKSKKNSQEPSTTSEAAPSCPSNPGSAAVNAFLTAPRSANQTPLAANGSSSQCGVPLNAGSASHSSPAISSQNRQVAVGPSTSARSKNPPNILGSSSNGTYSASSANPTKRTDSIKDVGSSSTALNLTSGESGGPAAHGESSMKESDVRPDKSLVEGIRAALGYDKDRCAAFKIISKEYREGEIDAREYLAYVHQFGLAHFIRDLARLWPDPEKQNELMEIHKTSLENVKENGQRRDKIEKSGSKGSKKGKEKCEDAGSGSKREALPDGIVNHLTELKLNSGPYKNENPSSSRGADSTPANGIVSNNTMEARATGSKKKPKKNPKSLRERLGESSASEAPNLSNSDPASHPMSGLNQDSILASVRGVWRNGGGRRLVAMSQASALT